MLEKASALMQTLGLVRLPPDLAAIATRYRLPEPALAPHRRAQTLEDVNKAFGLWLKKKDAFRPGERAYSRIDSSGRVFQAVSMAWPNKKKAPENYFIALEHPISGKPCPVPDRGWRNPPRTMARLLAEERIIFGQTESTQPRRKYFLDETRTESVPSIIRDAGCDDKRLSRYGVPFDHAKPLSLARKIVRWFTRDPGDLVLDFFAGSGTAGHAVLAENAERHSGLNFWLIQRAEPVRPKSAAAQSGFEHVAQMTRARLRAAVEELDAEYPVRAGEDRGFLSQRLRAPS
jgi:adenine-specific DNA-methyltransferase